MLRSSFRRASISPMPNTGRGVAKWGLIVQLMSLLFGGGKNLVRETAEVFTTNAEAQAVRDLAMSDAALEQFSKGISVT